MQPQCFTTLAHSKGICHNQLKETQKRLSLEQKHRMLPSAMATVYCFGGVVNSGFNTLRSLIGHLCGITPAIAFQPFFSLPRMRIWRLIGMRPICRRLVARGRRPALGTITAAVRILSYVTHIQLIRVTVIYC